METERANEWGRHTTFISKLIIKYLCPFVPGHIKSPPRRVSFHSLRFIKRSLNIWYKNEYLNRNRFTSGRFSFPHFAERGALITIIAPDSPCARCLPAKPPTGLQWRWGWYHHWEEDKMYYYHYSIFKRVWLWQEVVGSIICMKHSEKINWVKFLTDTALSNLLLHLLSFLKSQLWRKKKKSNRVQTCLLSIYYAPSTVPGSWHPNVITGCLIAWLLLLLFSPRVTQGSGKLWETRYSSKGIKPK